MNDDLRVAGRGRRFMATLIDALLVPVFAIFLMWLTGVMETAHDYASYPGLRIIGLGIASYLILNTWLLWAHGQTIGKRIFGMAIVGHRSGERVPLWKLLLIRGPAFLVLPVIDELPIFARQRRCIHDRLAGTQVIRRSKSKPEMQ